MRVIGTPSPGYRSGFVGLIGRPNVGKSTIMNHLVGQKVSITSPVSQTTRNQLLGIITTHTSQIIFVDTPGIHKPHHQLGKILVASARAAISRVDLVLFVVDGSTIAGRGDQFIADLLHRSQTPVILGINKIDLRSTNIEPNQAIEQSYQSLSNCSDWPKYQFSALTPSGLDLLHAGIEAHLPNGPYYYPPEMVTDQPERFIMGELIREQILLLTRQEIPHSVAITIDRVEAAPKLTKILATIHVERQTQKMIVIGKRGEMLKAIGSAARQQIQKLISGKVYLELFVKVQPKWRQSQEQLSALGYTVAQ